MEWLLALWTLLVANWGLVVFTVALPFAANLVSKSTWPSDVRGYIVLGCCFVVGVLTPVVAGVPITPGHVLELGAALYGGATAAYLVFKRFDVTCQWLELLLKFGSNTDEEVAPVG
jgi:hypothetical protein